MFRLGFAEHVADPVLRLAGAAPLASTQAFAPYLVRAAGRGLLDAAKDLLFEATSRERSSRGVAPFRYDIRSCTDRRGSPSFGIR